MSSRCPTCGRSTSSSTACSVKVWPRQRGSTRRRRGSASTAAPASSTSRCRSCRERDAVKDVWDVAVVGAGPAGAAAARAAASTGARTVLLERAQIPRYKRCGGGLIGLSQQAIRDAGVDASTLACDDVGRITFTSNGRRRFQRETGPFLPMVMRAELDAALVTQATDAGAELRTGITVNAYDETAGVITLGTSVGPMWARAVVGADGSQGRCAAYVGVQHEHVDIGL